MLGVTVPHMISGEGYIAVLVTAPDQKTARQLVRLALEAHLVACGNIIPGVESHYWWQGKIDISAEILILLKTTSRALPELEKLVLANHPYETPELIALDISQGNGRYLQWIQDNIE